MSSTADASGNTSLWLIIGLSLGGVLVLVVLPAVLLVYYFRSKKQERSTSSTNSTRQRTPSRSSREKNHLNSNVRKTCSNLGSKHVSRHGSLRLVPGDRRPSWKGPVRQNFDGPGEYSGNALDGWVGNMPGQNAASAPEVMMPWPQGNISTYHGDISYGNYPNPLQERMGYEEGSKNIPSVHQSIQNLDEIDEAEDVPKLQHRNSRVSFVGVFDV